MTHDTIIAEKLSVPVRQVTATITLLDAGNTLPFIARYRKEATGGLDEEQIRILSEQLETLRAMDERRQTILSSIDEQGKLTPELRAKIEAATTRTELEDIYQPYKPKRRTRASIARERGLQGLADLILKQQPTQASLEELAKPYLKEEVPTIEEAWAGARDIVAETINDQTEVRQLTREGAMRWGVIHTEKIENAEDPKQVYEVYYAFEARADQIRPHQVLAMNRGEAEKVLRVKLALSENDWKGAIGRYYRPNPRSPLAGQLTLAIQDAGERLLLPAIERDIRRALTEKAEKQAISVFAANLRALLNQPPLVNQTVMGIDPGFRTGSKAAVVDPTGKVMATATIYPHEPQKKWKEALEVLGDLIRRHGVTLLSIGNGTASRETEQLAAELLQNFPEVHYLITNEAGASVYSASPLARAELPDMDVSMRGAVSIARRVQDPLAELVKIDPKAIGVGMYQHDVDQTELARTLQGVVESVVNQVGVDVNTASPALLTYVSGIGPKLSVNIVAFRNENGTYPSRDALKKVSGLGPKAFEQAAGFLRVRDGLEPLDASAIHPESYPATRKVMQMAGITPKMESVEVHASLDRLVKSMPLVKLAQVLEIGEPTLKDILEQLARPGRDPRQDLPKPILRRDVLSMDDLTTGMILKGTVRNVVDFGVFVDIGVKHDGLLHRSQIPAGTALRAGEIIGVKILKVETERGRISLGWAEQN